MSKSHPQKPIKETKIPPLISERSPFVAGFDLAACQARVRLGQHMSILQGMGMTDLSSLGTLEIGSSEQSGILLQPSGVLYPTGRAIFQSTRQMLSGIAMKGTNNGSFENISGLAWVLNTLFPSVDQGGVGKAQTIPLARAYWFAKEIILQDDVTVVLANNVKALVIIAEQLTIGQGVTISWERPTPVAVASPSKPPTPPPYPQALRVGSLKGRDGAQGGAPNVAGPTGNPAPEVEIWFLNSAGFPAVDLRGQDGGQGIKGGEGGDGGQGQKGCNTRRHLGFCRQEKGGGGDGGNGGRAGDGGRGGDGGTGGIFSVYAPQPMINSWLQTGLTISLDGGSPGAGGDPGQPGEGGPGGARGDHIHRICPSNNRGDGKKGNTGNSGVRGADGEPGSLQRKAIHFSAITPSDFNIETAKPAILMLVPTSVYVGDTVTVNGLRFARGDKVYIEGEDGQISVPCVTTFVADSLLTFKVPAVPGGYAFLEVEQVDATRSSNHGTLTIRPRVEAIIPAGKIQPGQSYFLKGTGLGRSGSVWINGEGSSPFTRVDAVTVKFKALRPINVQRNESGEAAKLKLVNAEGGGPGNPNHSAELDVVFDTFRIFVFGDSVMWGGGLPEYQKFYSLAIDFLAPKLEGIGVYKTVEAHHGAKIGLGDATIKEKMPGELSSRYPTILQQVESAGTVHDAMAVKLVFVGGGANDLPITNFTIQTSPEVFLARRQELIDKTKQYCLADMTLLLQKIAAQFPNAKIIVTGYYHIFSSESNPSPLTPLFLSLMDGNPLPDWPAETVNKLVSLCDAWIATSNPSLARAVNQVNAMLPGEERIYFVDPESEPRHAAFASDSLLWEPDKFGWPTDPMWDPIRKTQREEYKTRLKTESSDLNFFMVNNGYKVSKRNSSFHPNPAGAARYFDKIRPILDLTVKATRVAIRAKSGAYLSAEGGGGGALMANQSALGLWETFEMIDLGSSQVGIKSVNGQYLSASGAGGRGVMIDKDKLKSWETFTLVPRDPDTGLFAFMTINGANYLSANSGGGVTASADQIGDLEEFKIY